MDLSLRPRSLQYDGSQRSLLNDSPCTHTHTGMFLKWPLCKKNMKRSQNLKLQRAENQQTQQTQTIRHH